MLLRTEYEFVLPHGVPGDDGELHRHGVMRVATARDEIEPLGDVAVRRNQAYLAILLLSRTVTRIGPYTEITPSFVEGLLAVDFDHLQRTYERVNAVDQALGGVCCPECQHEFDVDLLAIQDSPPGK